MDDDPDLFVGLFDEDPLGYIISIRLPSARYMGFRHLYVPEQVMDMYVQTQDGARMVADAPGTIKKAWTEYEFRRGEFIKATTPSYLRIGNDEIIDNITYRRNWTAALPADIDEELTTFVMLLREYSPHNSKIIWKLADINRYLERRASQLLPHGYYYS